MILYLGNNLTLHGNTPSSIETLGKLLGSRYVVKRFSSKQNQILRWLDMMVALIRFRRGATVVLIDTYSSLAFYYALGASLICRWLKIPYVPILRGGNLRERLKQNPKFSNVLFGGAHTLIAPSGYLDFNFREFGYTNITYIPNSIELRDYIWQKRNIVKPKLLWVRSFHDVYNPVMAIDVLKRISERFHNAELCMVGPDKDGSLIRCKEYASEIGLRERTKFTGVLSKQDWHQLAKDYDIFINTTTVDNTPVSVIEAMALGLPVISTNVGGVPYLIKLDETGLLVNSGDVEDMANKIIFLVENSAKAKSLSLNARQYVEQFDWHHIKQEWFSLLDKFETPNS